MKLYTLAFVALTCAAQTHQPNGVAVFMQFENQPSDQALTLMQQETGLLLAPAGIVPLWYWLPKAGLLAESSDNVLLVRFKGACRTGVSREATLVDPFAPTTMRLAATRTRGSTVLPFAEVECDAIRQIANTVPVRERAKALGQALGRVVAHELYHLLLQTKHHATEGLAKAVLSWSELLNATFDLSDLSQLATAGK